MNAPWTDGYVAELDYPHGYTADLSPARLALPFLCAGLAVPEVVHACELGFGQGLSLNIHAAGSTAQWHGTDFLPVQALQARHTAQSSGAKLQLSDQSFAEFCTREDLPEFDFIALHGVWSWISAENRAVIVDFLRRKLRLGGVLYMGYNTLPGWSATLAVRELLLRHVQHLGSPHEGLAGRVKGALAFAEQLVGVEAGFATDPQAMRTVLEELKKQDPRYLAHEYLNADWHPMFFSDVATALAPAKLSYACSAHHEVERALLTPEQAALLRDIADPVFQESTRDLLINQRFRKDYWVKGARRLGALEQAQALRELRVVLKTPQADVQRSVLTPRGAMQLNPQAMDGLLDVLASHQPQRIGALEQRCARSGATMPQLLEVLMILVATGDLALAQSDTVIAAVKPQTDRLNLHLMTKALGSGQVTELASPVTGCGVSLTRVEQLLAYASLDSSRKQADLAPLIWQVLQPQGVRMLRQGRALDGDTENLAEIARVAHEFMDKRLPVLRALGVIPNATKAA